MTSQAAISQIDARVAGQALVASFMNAEPPKVWRADMAKLGAATLELRSDAGRFRLVMIAEGREEDVAVFNTREDGTAALQAVMRAMVEGGSASAPAAAAPAAAPAAEAPAAPAVKKKPGALGFIGRVLVWMLAIVVVLVILAGLLLDNRQGQIADVLGTPSAPSARPGVPTPADEFFR